jgi:dihydrofolate reductase
MDLRIITAMTRDGYIIGKNGRLPWKYARELQYFKDMTVGSAIIMGRKTFEGFKKPLPDREHLVLSSVPKQSNNSQVKYFTNIQDILDYCEDKTTPIYVIGGASIYQSFLPLADLLCVTFIEKDYDGDTIFPPVNWDEWKLISEIRDDKDPLTFCIYEKDELWNEMM